MQNTWTMADFGQLSWHDCHLWGLQLEAGDGAAEDWTSDLRLDIDFIVEWICGVGEPARFRVAPADLRFHDVTDLALQLQPDHPAAALHPWSIDAIERTPFTRGEGVSRPGFHWRIRLNWPAGSVITLGAAGFSQRLRRPPVLTERQHLDRHR